MLNKLYDKREHVHRFAVWTAARAVQRSFTNTGNIETAIDNSNIRDFVNDNSGISTKEFDDFFRTSGKEIIKTFYLSGVESASFGRAAKVMSIYFKTSIIIASSFTDVRCEIIHPPIDSILLNKISMLDGLKELKGRIWTQFDEDEYFEVINIIRDSVYPCNWKLEEYWAVNRKKALRNESQDQIGKKTN